MVEEQDKAVINEMANRKSSLPAVVFTSDKQPRNEYRSW